MAVWVCSGRVGVRCGWRVHVGTCVCMGVRRGTAHCFLQDNKITRLSGVEHLVNLQVLALGFNQISEFRDIQVRSGVA
jgi:hypothetical protein